MVTRLYHGRIYPAAADSNPTTRIWEGATVLCGMHQDSVMSNL